MASSECGVAQSSQILRSRAAGVRVGVFGRVKLRARGARARVHARLLECWCARAR